ncbi:MAG: hypothetical protein ACQEXC_09015 [Pseudomonadota bacterium]
MFKTLFGRKPIRVWIIKQVDMPQRLIHLCGRGTLATDLKPREALNRLRSCSYQGGVRVGDTGWVLHARLFEGLVPEEELTLPFPDRALWLNRSWRISHVPQHCWTWEGQLKAEPSSDGDLTMVSREDVGFLQQRIDTSGAPPGRAIFRPLNALEDPEKDIREAIKRAQRRRQAFERPAESRADALSSEKHSDGSSDETSGVSGSEHDKTVS